MRRRYAIHIGITIGILLLASGSFAPRAAADSAELVVIVHPAVDLQRVTVDRLRALFSGETEDLPGGAKALIVEPLYSLPLYEEFTREVLELPAKRVWSRYNMNLFRGKTKPHQQLRTPEGIVEAVAGDETAIGYAYRKHVNDSVKIVEVSR